MKKYFKLIETNFFQGQVVEKFQKLLEYIK